MHQGPSVPIADVLNFLLVHFLCRNFFFLSPFLSPPPSPSPLPPPLYSSTHLCSVLNISIVPISDKVVFWILSQYSDTLKKRTCKHFKEGYLCACGKYSMLSFFLDCPLCWQSKLSFDRCWQWDPDSWAEKKPAGQPVFKTTTRQPSEPGQIGHCILFFVYYLYVPVVDRDAHFFLTRLLPILKRPSSDGLTHYCPTVTLVRVLKSIF